MSLFFSEHIMGKVIHCWRCAVNADDVSSWKFNNTYIYIILWFTVLIFNVNINYNMIIYINLYVDLNYIEWTQLFDQLWDLNPGPRKLAGLVWNVCTVQHYKYVCIIVQMCTICRTSCVWQNRAWAQSWNYQTNQS